MDDWRALGDMASAIVIWDADLRKIESFDVQKLKMLGDEFHHGLPSATGFSQAVLAGMCHQILLRDFTSGTDAQNMQAKSQALTDTVEMEKFAKKFLRLSKKVDYPPQYGQVDKLMKEFKGGKATK